MASKAFEPFQLPNGTVLKNRVGKAAMEERLSDVANDCQPTPELIRLYKAWGDGGAGLILSGHIMIDPLAMAAPGDVLLAHDAGHLDEAVWRNWINTTQAQGAQFWFQINHPGRQIPKGSGLPTYGPSAVAMKMGKMSKMFAVPREMTEAHIQDVIQRFVWAARKAEELGASGVQIHAAHGYLISQFLSPLTNHRTDRWGGQDNLENRARLLLETVRAVRAAVSPTFGVGIKINTADFQRGGFAPSDFLQVVTWLNDTGLDLLEVSGGSYESPVMTTGEVTSTSTSTAKREAYFLAAAQSISTTARMPIMVTGGIRRLSTLTTVLASDDQFIAGIGSAAGYIPDLPLRWSRGEDPNPVPPPSWLLSGRILAAARILSVQYNLHAHARAVSQWISVWPVWALLSGALVEMPQMRVYKKRVGALVERRRREGGVGARYEKDG